MEFEFIGGNSSGQMYSLVDYSKNPYGDSIMCVEINPRTFNWWFVDQLPIMTKEHMSALNKLLTKLLSEYSL